MIVLDINTKIRATTQYKNFCFPSMVRFGDTYLGASDDGLFEIGGDDDDGVEIAASFKLPTSNLGYEQSKRIRYMYFSLESRDDLVIEVVADEGLSRKYDIPITFVGKTHRIRIPIGRDIKGAHFSFELSNKKGCDFSIDSIRLLPVVRSYGHR